MSSIIESLSSLIKALSDSLRLPSLFPALTLVVLNGIFIFPFFEARLVASPNINLDLLKQPITISLLVLMLSYMLSAFEVSIIKLYEGYSWQGSPIGQVLRAYYMNQLLSLKKRSRQLRRSGSKQVGKDFTTDISDFIRKQEGVVKYRIDNEYPSIESVLPTKIGNTIASFEAYSLKRYNMDSIIFFGRMIPILASNNYIQYIHNARSTADFLLNTSLVMNIFGFECILMRIFMTKSISWIFPVTAFLVAWVLCRAAMGAIAAWATYFKSSFDLYRYHLADALGLKIQASLNEEREQWRDLGEFYRCWDTDSMLGSAYFDGFNHKHESWPVEVKLEEEKK